jgi:hypothetical protein
LSIKQEGNHVTSDPKATRYFIHRGRFLQVENKPEEVEKRNGPDRRKTLRGDPSKSETGQERRVGSRRLEDVIITIELKDPNRVFVHVESFKKFAIKNLYHDFGKLAAELGAESLINITTGEDGLFVETKLKFRDKVKQWARQKGLFFEVIDNGEFIGGAKKTIIGDEVASIQDAETTITPELSEISAIMGFPADSLDRELQSIVFKVFVKCLNEVHPVSGSWEHDALKQNVSIEQRIIFMAGKHFPKSQKYTYKTIVEQVFTDCINEYNKIIQMEADLHKLEERFRLSNDNRLKAVIQVKKEEVDEKWESSLESTIRTLYLYLDYFKEIVKVGSTRERIETIFKKVNEKQIEVLNLKTIYQQLIQLLQVENSIQQQNSAKAKEHLGYLKWLKNEINNEVYFTRHLWINNMKGKAQINNAIERTLKAINGNI